MEMQKILLDSFYSGLACAGFAIVYNIRQPSRIFFSSLGGFLGWATYLASQSLGNDLLAYFLATIVISIYSEIMARVFRCPVTTFLLISLFPLVPGGGIYYTMEHCINGDTSAFIETGLHTFGVAGSLAVGILLVSSLTRLWSNFRYRHSRLS